MTEEQKVSVLRKATIEQLLSQLDRLVFSRHSFDCSFNDANGTLVEIRYRDNPYYFFRVTEPKTESNSTALWIATECPGRSFTSAERYNAADYNAAVNGLSNWLNRLFEEIAVVPNKDDATIAQMRSNLDAAANALKDPDKPFSPDELVEWTKKFDDLIERLAKLEADNALQSGELEKLKRQIETLKQHGAVTPKRTWVKSVGNKILDAAEFASKTASKPAIEAAVKHLLEYLGK